MMRLRHKKPLNSYAGQGNCDSNEAQDEDFAKNSMHNRKTRLLKIRPANEQTRKYAEILCEFVTVVNQDYRNYCTQFGDPRRQAEETQQKNKTADPQVTLRARKDNFGTEGAEVVSKQQQKIRRPEIIINKNSSSLKKQKKTVHQIQEPLKQKQEAQLVASQPNIAQSQKTPVGPNLTSIPQKQKNFQQAQPAMMNQMPNMGGMPTLQQMQQLQQLQLLQNQIYAMNSMNSMNSINPMSSMNSMGSGMFPMYQFMPQLLEYQIYMEQLMKANPFAALQMQKIMLGQNPQSMGNTSNIPNLQNTGYIPFSKLPISRPNLDKKQERQQNIGQVPDGSMKAEQQVKSEANGQKIDRLCESFIQPIDLKKKSCIHVGIAYKIHFENIKQKGPIPLDNSEEMISRLDPTYAAKRLKQRNIKVDKKKKSAIKNLE